MIVMVSQHHHGGQESEAQAPCEIALVPGEDFRRQWRRGLVHTIWILPAY